MKRIRVGLHPSLAPWSPEIKYVFRTLLRIAGFPYEFLWVTEPQRDLSLDIYYGPDDRDTSTSVVILSSGRDFNQAPSIEPCSAHEDPAGWAFLEFELHSRNSCHRDEGTLRFSNDIVFSSYWMLTGARETAYPRDRWDNLKLNGSGFRKYELASKPLVSIYGAALRKHFERCGQQHLERPWRGTPAFAFTHDVDYPQIIRWIECVRLLGSRGLKGLGLAGKVARGTSHFWKFAEWVEFEKTLGARPTFYFMAKKGSLLQYATGTPDAFYDVHSQEFRHLFHYLKQEGCEVGLHASYNAYRDGEQLKTEKSLLQELSGAPVEGNRHHYWHLDPDAPHETIRLHEEAGLLYDSSLAFELQPGFRRGICHPFRVFHPGLRRELKIVELPPAWMDDHFDRRRSENGIADCEAHARGLINVAASTGGTVVVDYHVRGMNGDFFPQYGPWLMKFVKNHLSSSASYWRPADLAKMYIQYEEELEEHSRDLAIMNQAASPC